MDMKKNMKLFLVLKMEYGAGEENVFTEILHATSSCSTAKIMKQHYMEEFAEEIKGKNNRWVSLQLHQCGIQVDEDIIENNLFLRYIDGSSKCCKEQI
jgi:hypothetical protein